eukprot:CAMPEP_0171988880 /NCGR_PEP_ID=MMETSP0993-20121228/276128_1 /TAXON_ID=483369 /ORGANISM="non described non described, Strain CCMP2098" /LENGTH=716 /DNA_ID=CAMNT_0012641857 /DNA_START=77 /DNA_END=2228 /DNA_ORIENTATION=+
MLGHLLFARGGVQWTRCAGLGADSIQWTRCYTNKGSESKGFNLPRWGTPGNWHEQRQEDNDPKNILKRFENPAAMAVRAKVFGPSYSLKTMTGEDAWREFGLSASNLAGLPSMERLGVVHDSSSITRLYNKFEVQDAAILRFGGEDLAFHSLQTFLRRRKACLTRRRSRIHSRNSGFFATLATTLQIGEGPAPATAAAVAAAAAAAVGRGEKAKALQEAVGTGGGGGGGGGGQGRKGKGVAGGRGDGSSGDGDDEGGGGRLTATTRKGHVIGSRAVTAAIVGNTAVLATKLVAYAYTGSGAMLSEAIHSGADVMNQSLLFYGLRRSSLNPDSDHPYGYGFETYVWSMISAVGSFFLGAGASIYHGSDALWHALSSSSSPVVVSGSAAVGGDVLLDSPAVAADLAAAAMMIEAAPIALTVLGFAGLLESYTAWIAWIELSREAKRAGMTSKDYITHGPDPVNVAVFLEDVIAVGGVGVAAAGIGLTVCTGNVAFDALGSIGVGLLMGGVSVFVIAKNRRLLGQSVPKSKAKVVALLLQDEIVMSCLDVKAVTIRPGVCRFKAEIQFNPTTLADKYLDQHPDNLPGISASLSRALEATATLKQTRKEQKQEEQQQPSSNTDSSSISSSSSSSLDEPRDESAERAALRQQLHRYSRMLLLSSSSLDEPRDESAERAALRQQLHRYSRMLLLTLALEVDRLEELIRKHHPEYHYIDIEVL